MAFKIQIRSLIWMVKKIQLDSNSNFDDMNKLKRNFRPYISGSSGTWYGESFTLTTLPFHFMKNLQKPYRLKMGNLLIHDNEEKSQICRICWDWGLIFCNHKKSAWTSDWAVSGLVLPTIKRTGYQLFFPVYNISWSQYKTLWAILSIIKDQKGNQLFSLWNSRKNMIWCDTTKNMSGFSLNIYLYFNIFVALPLPRRWCFTHCFLLAESNIFASKLVISFEGLLARILE